MAEADAGPDRIFHLATAQAWAESFTTGEYRESTLGMSLDDVGFIHCSYAHQVRGVADGFYKGRSDVVLLVVDTARVGAPIVVEAGDDTGELFPHLYGALPVVAVVAAPSVGLLADGRLDLDPYLAP
jgi:glutathione S-transferase